MTNTKLKIIALVTMFIDHFGHFIPDTPEWFRWIGRIAAPIFIYCVVIGYKNTSNRKKYLVRLGVAAVGMSFLNLIINLRIHYLLQKGKISSSDFPYLEFNFFSTLFLIALLIILLEKKKIKFLIWFFCWQFVSISLFPFMEINGYLPEPISLFTIQISGNLLVVEGGVLMISLGIFLYFSRGDKWKTAIGYSLYCLTLFYLVRRWGWRPDGILPHLFGFADYQWMMIFALPLMLLYNGKKGIGLKYFFYLFYPLHIVILFFIGFLLA
ncbi:TraX family protein [Halalkalibacter urbisdiaboli]|uniref:TraX family protein n=1 Tax=Halalkalibacter urbisdiaboli TaxID=1960589 RepID=UPI000B43BFE1|nr:TraX family protein [Halalkalibacter urbisdiaboli]